MRTRTTIDCDGAVSDPHCSAETSVEWDFGGPNVNLITNQAVASAMLGSAADVVLDVGGSTVGFPSNGQVTVTIMQGSSVLAAKQFGWTKVGSSLVLSNPAAVDSWGAGYANTADGIEYDLAQIDVAADPGMNTFSVETKFQGQVITSASTTFCYSPRMPPSPHLPRPCI